MNPKGGIPNPYGDGWIIKIKLSNTSEIRGLIREACKYRTCGCVKSKFFYNDILSRLGGVCTLLKPCFPLRKSNIPSIDIRPFGQASAFSFYFGFTVLRLFVFRGI